MIVLFSLFYIHNIIYLLSYLLFSILARHKKVNVILLRLSILLLHNCVKRMSEEIEKLFYYFSLTFKKKKEKIFYVNETTVKCQNLQDLTCSGT